MADRPESTVTREAGIAHAAETMACLEAPEAKETGNSSPGACSRNAASRYLDFGSQEDYSLWPPEP